ncbi:RasGEF domain-containing serine/threonine-protein kinase X [Hondaea fermentalgiana]|uniref:RasGEF domain-containing serine/threonine-protein kinase X n=1 Tax=Hondaea fermentalgiana TaxID=2315210 RepID=A0A2R5G0L1_9STRA|nr:RasGEF domain-containing serine/threonine-protein kinase X [Hondaea fermentalgiana]|eukprot:GBG23829.1 RasGEF domain-containing serine/threonine-protein kinase X [Hondaea fermentalgiana]
MQMDRPVSMTPVLDFGDNDFDLDKSKVKLLDVLGRGAFSTVYKAEYTGLVVAIKKQKLADPDLERYIRKELAILRRCNHPGLVKYIGACKVDEKTIYIATEYCRGGDLRRLLQSSRALGWKLRANILRGVADALEYMHDRGLIHRDVKTENVLLDETLNPKLCDFGFARDAAPGTDARGRVMTMCGTDEFMAPEVIFGMAYDTKADVFGFGIIIAETIARKVPGKRDKFLVRKPMTGFTADAAELKMIGDLYDPPSSLLLLCEECLADEAEQRPTAKDCNEWLEELWQDLEPDDVTTSITEEEMLREVRDDLAKRDAEAELPDATLDEDDHSRLGSRRATKFYETTLKRATLAAFNWINNDDGDDEAEGDDEDSGDEEGTGTLVAVEQLTGAHATDAHAMSDRAKAARAAARAAPAFAAAHKASHRLPLLQSELTPPVDAVQHQDGQRPAAKIMTMSGYVVKRGGRIKTWYRRFMVITSEGLVYFKSKEDFIKNPEEMQGSISFADMVVTPGRNSVADTVGIMVAKRQNAFRVLTQSRPRYFQTTDPRLSAKWNRLDGGNIGDDGAKALASAIAANTSLWSLRRNNVFNRVAIGNDGIKALAGALAMTTSLDTLDLQWNKFGNAGAGALATALESNDTLEELSLDKGEVSSVILARIADHVKLTEEKLDNMSAIAERGLKANVKVRWGRAKLMIVGKSAAGKTSTIRTLLDQPFNDDHVSTIGVDLTLTRTRDWKERETISNADLYEQFAKYKYRRQSFSQQVSFTIWDYGGQEVFYALHHLFLTQYGVYVLVFDMREVLGKEHFEEVLDGDKYETLASQKDALDTLRFWIDSIRLHAPNVSVALVGTYLDQVPDDGDHRAINQTIKSEVLKGLGGRPAVLRNRSSQLQFFPINNKDREDTDEHVSHLREALSESVANKDFVKDKVPLRWSYCLDILLSEEEDFLLLDEVEYIAEDWCNLPKEDVRKMLKYMHELGVLIHLTTGENDVLRQLVVIRPQWLLENLSCVICDPDMDHMQRHKDNLMYRRGDEDGGEFPSELDDALEEWSDRGVASRALLEQLWQDQPVDYLTELMESMLLACPSPWIGDKDEEGALLIPSLLKPVDEDTKKKALADLGRTFALAYIEFRILPKGVFQRLLASLVQLLPNRVSVGDHGVYADFASIVFDNVDVVMETSGNRLMLYFELPEDRSLSSHVVILKNSLDSIDSFFMKKGLDPKLYVSSDGSDHRAACASAKALADATNGEVSLVKRGKRLPLTSFGPFVESRSATRQPRLSIASTDKPYHVFLSHSWGEGRETHEKVKAVARELETRGIRYWLDEIEVGQEVLDSMANGIDRSKAVVVFVTREYMNKVNRGRSELDNCRDEFCYAFRRLKPANMIPCILDQEMSDMSTWEGRFGISWSGNPLYVSMWKGGEPDEIDALEAAINDVLRLQNEAAVRPEDVPASTTPAVHRRGTLSRFHYVFLAQK